MDVRKMNLVQLAGSLIALLAYLLLPIVQVMLLQFGFTGELCMQLDAVFVIPVVMLSITMLVSVLPIGKTSSVAGIVTVLTLLIIGLMSKNVAGSKIDILLKLAGLNTGLLTSGVASLVFRMGVGMIIAMVVMLITTVAGFLITTNDGASANRPNGAGYGYHTHSSRSSVPQRPNRTSSRPTYHR